MGAGIALALALGGCAPAPAPKAPAPAAGLRLGGSEALVRKLLPALARGFEAARGAKVRVVQTDDAGGLRELLAGDLDLVASSRDATAAEQEQARVDGFSFDDARVRHVVGVDVVAIAVHPRNPTESLTYDQVIGIFCTRAITSWAALGGDDVPVAVLVPPPGDGPRALFEDFFCGARGIHPALEIASTAHIASTLGTDERAVSFASLTEAAGKRLALRVQPDAAPVRPSQQNVVRGAYPLHGDLYLYARGVPKGDVAAFLAWIDGPDGQEVLDEQRFVPLGLRAEASTDPRPMRGLVPFEVDSATPDPHGREKLDRLLGDLERHQFRHVVLEGFTDDREVDPYGLSQRRAEAVRDLVVARAPETYVEIIPRGPSRPMAPNDTPYGRQVNRRVQVYVADEEAPADLPPAEAP